MSKTKELRLLVEKTKKELVKEIDKIVEWNLDESEIVQELYRQSKDKSNHNENDLIRTTLNKSIKNEIVFNELFQDASNYLKKTVMEELFHEYTLQTSDDGDNIIKKENE